MIFTSSSNYDEIRSQVACCHFKILTVNINTIIIIITHYKANLIGVPTVLDIDRRR